jgi:hypothetical protein
MYDPAARAEIADSLIHLRNLFRRSPRRNVSEMRTHERREITTKHLLSNLVRMKQHPTLHTVCEVADIFRLTLSGAHRLFGYKLEELAKFDFEWNSGRTHLIENYPFERDQLVELPAELGNEDAFQLPSRLDGLVRAWQSNIPIRALEEDRGWQRPGVFYARIGTEDSYGTNLPAGAVALVELISEPEAQRPNPTSTYLLQFGNGFRCSRCVVTKGKLLLLVSTRSYRGPLSFAYPGEVRIAGRVRLFASELPAPARRSILTLPQARHPAPLILPWEHRSLDRLLDSAHRRFERSRQERDRMQGALETVFQTKLSGRTERRYRLPTLSKPHVDVLIQLTLLSMARYTDTLGALQVLRSDQGRFSLNTLLTLQHLSDLSPSSPETRLPTPSAQWDSLRETYREWPSLLSTRFPGLQYLQDQIVRLPAGSKVHGLEPPIAPGSLIQLGDIGDGPERISGSDKTGWSRPIYALHRDGRIRCGRLDREAHQYIFLSGDQGAPEAIRLHSEELTRIRQVTGITVPI